MRASNLATWSMFTLAAARGVSGDGGASGSSGMTAFVNLAVRPPPLLRRCEAMHSRLPLQADDRSLGGLQQCQRADQRQRKPYRELKPRGRRVGDLDREDRRHDDVADHDDDQIGGEIIRAMMMEFLAACGAMVGDLEEPAEQIACSAMRAFHLESPDHGCCERNGLLDRHHGALLDREG